MNIATSTKNLKMPSCPSQRIVIKFFDKLNQDRNINFDEKLINDLLELCKKESKLNNYKDCNTCKLKFMCWTHRSIDEDKHYSR